MQSALFAPQLGGHMAFKAGFKMRRLVRVLMWFILLAIAAPVATGALMAYGRGWPGSWRTANWASSGLLAEASSVPEARVLIIAARTGSWKSIFAEHMSIILKEAGASAWMRYDVVGWGNPVRRDAFAADAFWYGNRPYIVQSVSGPEAETLIPLIEQSIARYPYSAAGSYAVWPGPNSNSFVAWVVRNTRGFTAELPPVAIGKDYLGPGLSFANAPSNTGYALSLAGLIGLTLALDEGVEFQVLGTAIGFDPGDLAIKLPALGKLSLFDLWN
jgi:hypothetical protein